MNKHHEIEEYFSKQKNANFEEISMEIDFLFEEKYPSCDFIEILKKKFAKEFKNFKRNDIEEN